MNKTVIIGGSFDPVTRAHEDLIKNLTERFSKTIVVPCRVSPFKNGTSECADFRLKMLETALAGLDIEISHFEINSKEPNYSYITARHYSCYTPLYFCIGSEMLPELYKWKMIDDLAKTVVFYVVPRPGYPIDPEMISRYSDMGIRTEFADFSGIEGSSSEVKIALVVDKYDMFLSEHVAEFVKNNGLYTDYKYISALYKKYNMKQKRIDHSISTALCGVKLAKRLGVDMHKAITALLLHDIGKYVTTEQAEKMGIKFRKEFYDMPNIIRHAEIGAEIVRQIEKIDDEDIVDAIRWHTTGKPDMTDIEKVVYLADYIEPTRDFEGVEYIRKETEKSVDKGLFAGLENALDYVNKDKLYPSTIEAYEYYKEFLNK